MLGGALSGGVMAGGSIAINAYQNGRLVKEGLKAPEGSEIIRPERHSARMPLLLKLYHSPTPTVNRKMRTSRSKTAAEAWLSKL